MWKMFKYQVCLIALNVNILVHALLFVQSHQFVICCTCKNKRQPVVLLLKWVPSCFCRPVYIYFWLKWINLYLSEQDSTSMNSVVCRQYDLLWYMNIRDACFVTVYRGLLLLLLRETYKIKGWIHLSTTKALSVLLNLKKDNLVAEYGASILATPYPTRVSRLLWVCWMWNLNQRISNLVFTLIDMLKGIDKLPWYMFNINCIEKLTYNIKFHIIRI